MTAQVDYEIAFRHMPGAVALLSPDLVILDVSFGFLDAAGCGRDEIVGLNILDAFPENPHDPEDTGPREFRASLESVLATGEPDFMNPTRYDAADRGHPGEFEQRYWAIANIPVCAPDGQVTMIVNVAQEVTASVHTAMSSNS